MRAILRQRLLRVASEADTLTRVRAVAARLFEQHEQANQALKTRDVSALSEALHASRKTIAQLRYILGMGEK